MERHVEIASYIRAEGAEPGVAASQDSGNLAGEFLRSAAYAAVQAPLDGASQLVDHYAGTSIGKHVHFMDAAQAAEFGTREWYAQQLGGGVGMALPFMVLNGALSRGAAGGAAFAERVGYKELAQTIAKFPKAHPIMHSALTGAVYEGVFAPSHGGADESFALQRLKSAGVGALTFGTLTASTLGLGRLAQAKAVEGTLFKPVLESRIATGILSGVPAGIVNAEAAGGGRATPQELFQAAYGFAVVGGTLGAFHKAPKQEQFEPSRSALEKVPVDAENLLDGGIASGGRSEVVWSERADTMAGQIIKSELADGTQVMHWPFEGIKQAAHPDGRVVTEHEFGTRTENPDFSYVESNSWKETRRTADGAYSETLTKWGDAVVRWDELSRTERLDALKTVSQAPRGGDAVEKLVEKGIHYDSDRTAQLAAIRGLPKIEGGGNQLHQWQMAYDTKPHLQPQLDRVLSQLDSAAQTMLAQRRAEASRPADEAQAQHRLVREIVGLQNDYLTRLRQMDSLGDRELYYAFDRPFELARRVQSDQLTTEQRAATLRNVHEMLDMADEAQTGGVRMQRAGNAMRVAALQAMNQAADPLIITQGRHPTCALASLELSVFTRHPDQATRAISEVMRTGQFVTTDGTTIKIDARSLKPETNSLDFNKTDLDHGDHVYAYRSYASQVFQLLAANIYWQRQTTAPDGRAVPRGSLRYEMWERTNAYGERVPVEGIVDYSLNKPTRVTKGPYILTLEELTDIGGQIGGEKTVPSVLPDNSPLLQDEARFAEYLRRLQYPQAFPLIISVDAHGIDNPNHNQIRLNHAISILAPFKLADNISYHNTWEPSGKIGKLLGSTRFWAIMGGS